MPLDWTHLTVRLAPGDSVGRVRCEPGWSLFSGWSDRLFDFDLWYVWAGRGRMSLSAGRTLDLHRGVCLWMRPGGHYHAEQDPRHRLGVTFIHFDLLAPAPGMPSSQAAGKPARGRLLQRQGSASRARPRRGFVAAQQERDNQPLPPPLSSLTLLPPHLLPPEVYEVPDPAYLDAALKHVVDLHRGAEAGVLPEVGAPLAERLLASVLAELEARADAPGPNHPMHAGTSLHHRQLVLADAAAIRESPANFREGAVANLARAAGYTPDHYARVFRNFLGVSPQDYIVDARIDRARLLLRESPLTLTQIADALGYRDVYFFSRQFKSRTGTTPSAYRAASHAPPPPPS